MKGANFDYLAQYLTLLAHALFCKRGKRLANASLTCHRPHAVMFSHKRVTGVFLGVLICPFPAHESLRILLVDARQSG